LKYAIASSISRNVCPIEKPASPFSDAAAFYEIKAHKEMTMKII